MYGKQQKATCSYDERQLGWMRVELDLRTRGHVDGEDSAVATLDRLNCLPDRCNGARAAQDKAELDARQDAFSRGHLKQYFS